MRLTGPPESSPAAGIAATVCTARVAVKGSPIAAQTRGNPGGAIGCRAVRTDALLLLLALSVAIAAAAGCGTTEESGSVGDTLEAKGLRVTVEAIDTSVPAPKADVTGLSQPTPGSTLVGVRARVCNGHGGAIGGFDFGLETSDGAEGRLRHPQRSYPKSLDTVRDGCGGGWVVFEIPEHSRPERVSFGFEDTGTAMDQSENVDARFSWSIG